MEFIRLIFFLMFSSGLYLALTILLAIDYLKSQNLDTLINNARFFYYSHLGIILGLIFS